MFKKIYIEITNGCNLNCSFCIKNQRKIHNMSYEEFCYIIDKIHNLTKEIYLHVLGEPLMHKDINRFIEYANKKGLKVNITTNGYLINNIDTLNINRLNISLHSFNSKYNIDISKYLNNILDKIDILRNKTFISLRLWVNNDNTKYIIDTINKRYKTNIDRVEEYKKVKIANNLIIDSFHEFIWPDLKNNYYCNKGTCKGLIDHIGILSDGTVIPCCLDSLGIINLGNIYKDTIEEIMDKKLVKDMVDGFKRNIKCQELCKHCSFLKIERKIK